MASDEIRDREFIGQGLTFPLQVDSQGRLALTRGRNEIEQSIQIILETIPGERVMRPEFGCRVWELMFEPRNAETEAQIVECVEEALRMWEPRIDLVSVDVLVDSDYDLNVVPVRITYAVKNSHDERSVVYPFYLVDEPEGFEP